jgi:hypothetical protein
MNAPRKYRRRGPALAFLLLRLTLGLNICMDGVSRLAAGPAAFANSLVPMFQNTPLPAWSVHIFGLILPWAEAILGFLLLIGFCTSVALLSRADAQATQAGIDYQATLADLEFATGENVATGPPSAP